MIFNLLEVDPGDMQTQIDSQAQDSISMTSVESKIADVASVATNNPKRKKSSSVWNYFKRSDDKKIAKCHTCKREYKTSGNTTNLLDHLKRFHPSISSINTSESEAATSSDLGKSFFQINYIILLKILFCRW